MASIDRYDVARRGLVGALVQARVVDPRRRALPHFVIVGAQRSGTAALYQHVIQHPHVRPPLRKEVHFLTLFWERGLPWYRRHFPVLTDPAWRTLEASPYYLFHPDAPVRAAAALPDTCFIALLREPGARALSHFRHNRVNGLEPLSFEQALDAEEARLAGDRTGRCRRLYSYVGRGLYADQVRRWRDAVGGRLLVVLSDDLVGEPDRTFDQILAFVGLEAWEPPDFHASASRVTSVAEPIAEGARRRLQERFAAPNRDLAELLGRDLAPWDDGIGAHEPSPSAPFRGSSAPRSPSRT